MKLNRTLLAVGLFSALPVMSFGQSTNSDLTASASKAQIQPSHPVAEYKLEAKFDRASARAKLEELAKSYPVGSAARADIEHVISEINP